MRRGSRPYADLHVHTTASDGRLDLDAVPHAARRASVSVVAITDHDRLHPALSAPVSRRHGVTIVRGIELRVEAGQPVDLLGYAVVPTPALSRELDRIQADRAERGRRIVERVEDRLGVAIDVEPRPGLGRPHIAHAIAAHPDAPYDYVGAFEHLIGDGGPCYVPRSIPSFGDARELLSASSALVGLAHPLRYDDVDAALALAPELDAVERWYPYGDVVDPGPIDALLGEQDLVATGGSDAHGDRLGTSGLTARAYRAVSRRLPG